MNWIKRLLVILNEDGRVYHFGDGKDYILIRKVEPKKVAPNILDYKEAYEYGAYLRSIGFKDIRVNSESIFRFKCGTSDANMAWTNKMYQRREE